MTRAKAQSEEENGPQFGMEAEMVFLTMPIRTYKAISDAAAARGKTVGQALQEAISDYLREK